MIVADIANQARAILRHAPADVRRQLRSIFVFTLLMGFIELGVAGMVSLLGVALAAPQSVLHLAPTQMIIRTFPELAPVAADPAALLAILLLLVVAGVCCKNVLLGILTYRQGRCGYEFGATLGASLFRSFLSRDYLWHLQQNAAELLTVFGYRGYAHTYITALLALFTQMIIAVFLLAGGFILAPLPSLTVFALTGLAAAWTYKFARRRVRAYNTAIADVNILLSKDVLAGLHGIRDMRVYQREAVVSARVDDNMARIAHETAMTGTLASLPAWVLESVGMFTLLLALAAMILLNTSLAGITGALTLLAAMAWRLLPCMNKTVSAVVTMQGYRPYLDRFFASFAASAVVPPLTMQPPLPFVRAVTLRDVAFRYPQGQHDALRAVDLTLPRGGKVGIIGPSGAGKSTLIGILTGLLTPDSGVLRVDETPVSRENSGGFRALIGYVPQSPYLLDASLAENVAFSRWGDPVDEERVRTVCRMAAIDFWKQLPHGLHTEIGERGVRLSGGQAQRVAIARALYADPRILIFDEATSALDSATEDVIQQTIRALRDDITVVIVAHRLSTVEQCDIVYRLEEGKVAAGGKPDEILAAYQKDLASRARPAE